MNLFERAERILPGGVNSPVRAFRGVGGDPVFVRSAQGAWLEGEDGRRYSTTSAAMARTSSATATPRSSPPSRRPSARGTAFGAPTLPEVELAETIAAALPSVEMVRLVNSGTEATMSALRLARAATGRNRFVKFEGCYHGHADPFLVAAGSGAATIGDPLLPRRARGGHRRHPARALQRPRRRRAALRRQRWGDRRGHRRADRRQHEPGAARARLPRGAARPLRPPRRAADLRRGDDRLPRGLGRRAEPS